MPRGLAVHLGADNAMRRPMRTSIIAIAAGLLSWPAAADTLVSNINGIQVGADGKLQHFRALTIGDDGKVGSVLEHPELVRRPNARATLTAAAGLCCRA